MFETTARRRPARHGRRVQLFALGALAIGGLAGPQRALASIPGGPGAAASPVPGMIGAALGQPRLAGEGRLRWFGLQVYDARLFVPAAGIDPDRYARSPFALELRYARKLLGEDIAQASLTEIVRMGFGSEPQRQRWMSTMRSLFPDVTGGDRLTGINQADGKVVFYRNESRLGVVDDQAFGEAFFGIWLDPRTVKPDLRRALLANAASPRT